jgi:hypothetical protein
LVKLENYRENRCLFMRGGFRYRLTQFYVFCVL